MDIRRRAQIGGIKKTSSGGGSNTGGSYTVNLNSQWEATIAVPNPDSTLYDGVYRSLSNYNVNNGVATMYITIKDCSSFKIYIRSYAESTYDYVMVSQLDKTITGSTSYSDTTLIKAHTRGNQQSGTALSSYTLVEFTGISSGEHTITVVYRKDSSAYSGDDRGYVLIPKSNGSTSDEEGGDIEVDATYSIMYTSSDGNIVTPYAAIFGASLTNNVYINGVGYLTFSGPVTTIGQNAFKSCKLTSITIPDSVTSIGRYAFNSCQSLTSITIPDSVTSIREYAFKNCSSLTSITIPDGVTSIGKEAFAQCKSLTAVTIPASVTTMGESAFYNCPNLTRVDITDLSAWLRIAFSNEGYGSSNPLSNNAYLYINGDQTIRIPSDITVIKTGALNGCSNSDIYIHAGVTEIEARALNFNHNRVHRYYINSTIPPVLGSGAFYCYERYLHIYVPHTSVDVYKTAEGWSTYADYIVGYDF